jgi:hypothetical protein
MIKPLVYTLATGTRAASLYSGEVVPTLAGAPGATKVGSDVLFFTGAGRITGVVVHQTYQALSGVAGSFYDSSVAVSGGPIAASGHVLLAQIPGQILKVASGDVIQGGTMTPLNVPFSSGLCYNSRSGQPGVTVVWQPEDTVTRSGL